MERLHKIVSGGQTGADRAALDWAVENNVPYGGWCPKGRLAEDGAIDLHYQLQETPSSSYPQRTEWNARDSDGTVIFSIAETLTAGSKKTVELARKHGRPVLHLSKAGAILDAATSLQRFVEGKGIKVLNVAGPRGSKEPEVGTFVKAVLEKTWPR
jgi:hypothetical protein